MIMQFLLDYKLLPMNVVKSNNTKFTSNATKITSNRAISAGNALTEHAKLDWILNLPGMRNRQQPANL